MAPFITDDFLLQSKTAKILYNDYAANQPIIDFHSHIPPKEVAEDKTFKNLTQIWLAGDHYKWRAMRALGIDETYITGSAGDREKFMKWSEAVPGTARNPLFHWTHLELKRYFGIDELLTPDTADEIYEACNQQLSQGENSALGLLSKMNVEVVGTTDDPVDDLGFHRLHKESDSDISMHPTFRPDPVYAFHDPESWNRYIDQLETVSNISISSLDELYDALSNRIDFFESMGCRLSDHGLSKLPDKPDDYLNKEKIFKKIREGKPLDTHEQDALTFHILIFLGKSYHKLGWTQQFHLGPFRNTNTRLFEKLGRDTGFDSIGDFRQGEALQAFLDELDQTDELSKTILYNLNPADNALFATMAGNFNDGTVRGKVQHGPAWWFLDQKDGIEDQLNCLSRLNLLSTSVGMLTDSRSFLSYPRHEYFRRILCNLIGDDVENGELPADLNWLGNMISDICYNNAKQYFNFQG
jgi:glucuronate isomerase